MTGAAAGQPYDNQMSHESLGVRLFTPAPEGFDPVRASDRELLVHGYPGRPNAQRFPELRDHWQQMMSRSLRLIQPEFGPAPYGRRGSQLSYALPLPGGYGWAGANAFAADGDAFTFVAGQWTVPAVVVPSGQQGIYACANWVGIDGAGSAEDTSGDILQVGTTQVAVDELVGGFGYQGPVVGSAIAAWCEWYPDDAVTVSNFAVSPGDVVYAAICVHTPTDGGVYLANLTTGVLTSFIKTPKGGMTLKGDTAEWILESPYTSAGPGPLAQYGTVYFDNCTAGTRNGNLHLGGDSALWTMYNVDGQTISTPQRVTDRLITVTYTPPA